MPAHFPAGIISFATVVGAQAVGLVSTWKRHKLVLRKIHVWATLAACLFVALNYALGAGAVATGALSGKTTGYVVYCALASLGWVVAAVASFYYARKWRSEGVLIVGGEHSGNL